MAGKNLTLGAVFTAKTNNFINDLKKIEKSFRDLIKLSNQLGNTARSTAQNLNSKAYNAVDKSLKALTKSNQSLEQSIRKLDKSLRSPKQNMNSLAQTARATMKDFGGLSKNTQTFNGILNKTMQIAQGYSLFRLLAGSINQLNQALGAGLREIIDFDQALKNLQSITGANNDEISAMKTVIEDAARATKFSTSEIASGMILLGQAGFSAGESMDSIKSAATLAAGTLSDMNYTTDLLTSTIRSFNMQSSDSSKIADIYSNAINKSKLSIDKLRTAMGYLGVNARQAGLDLQETTALMSILADRGAAASTIGTGLRQVLSRAVKPGKALASALAESGLGLDALNPKVHDMNSVLKNMATLLWDSEKKSVDMTKAFAYFGLRGAQVGASLSEAFVQGGTWEKAMGNLEGVGTASKMAATQTEGLDLKFKNLADRAKLAFTALGDAGLNGVLHTFVDFLRAAATAAENFIRSGIGKFTITVSALSAGMIIANAGVLKMITGLKTLAAGMTAASAKAGILNAILSINPFVAAMAGIAGLIIILEKFRNENIRTAESLQALAVEETRNAAALKNYQAAIADAGSDSRKYSQVLQRMIADHPELEKELRSTTGALDLSTVSAEKLTDAMRSLEQQKAEKSLKSTAEAADRFGKELEKAENRLEGLRASSDTFGTLTARDFANAEAAVSKAGDAYQDAVRKIALSLRDQIQQQRMTVEQAENFIRTNAKSPAVAEKMKSAFVQAMAEIGKSTNGQMVKLQQSQGDVLKGMNKALEGMEGTLKKSLDGMDSLIQRSKDAAKSVKEVYQDLADLENDYYNDMRSLRQQTMTDLEKWNDDKAEADKLYREGTISGNRDVLEASRELYKSLSREVKDESGQTVKGIAETTAEAKKGVQAAYEAEKAVLEKQRAEREKTVADVKKQINELNSLVEGYGSKIAEISELGLDLDVSGVQDALKELNENIDDASSHIIQVDPKPAQGAIQSVSGMLSGLNSELDKPAEIKVDNQDALASVDELIQKYIQLQQEMKKAESGTGSGSPSMKFSTGGHVPGSLPGDRVPALLEAGEFVVKKPAVRILGLDLMHFLNNIQNAGRLSVEKIRERITNKIQHFNTGGIVREKFSGPIKNIVQHFNQGGPVLPVIPKFSFDHKLALPRVNLPQPIYKFAAGGAVPAAPKMDFPELGVVRLNINDKQFPILTPTDVGRMLIDEINKQSRMKPNK